MLKSFDEFVRLWKIETEGIKVKEEFKNFLFLVFYPDNVEWDSSIDKQTQTTTLMVSGGLTGASTGHDVQLCYRSEIHQHLLNSKHTHAMVVSVGMVFDMTEHHKGNQISSITDFMDFADSGEFCKAHIIARPAESAFLHYQHMNLNLVKWREFGCPHLIDSYKKGSWDYYTRSEENFHDDYTPPWIDVRGLPRIINFTEDERRRKAFSYFRDQETAWANISDIFDYDRQKNTRIRSSYVGESEPYFSRFMSRIGEAFYIFNTESLKTTPASKFDILFSPTAGYSAEAYVDKLDFQGTVILYDYCQENLDTKRRIIDMNMSLEEIYMLKEASGWNMVDNEANEPANQRSESMGTHEELRAMQLKMSEENNIEYWLMDLIKPDYNKLLPYVKGKKVFFDISNIYGYHMSHAYYYFDELVLEYNKLQAFLIEHTNKCWFQGTRPTKQWEKKWIS